MKAQFFDRQDVANAANGENIGSLLQLRQVLAGLRDREPFFAELIGDNGYKLLLGLGSTEGCAQFSSVDGAPPYLMAVGEQHAEGELEFLIGDTATPVPKKYCLPRKVIEDIAAEFVDKGQRKSDVLWEEI